MDEKVGCGKRTRYLAGGLFFGPILTAAIIYLLVSGESVFDAWWQYPVAIIFTVLGWWTLVVAIRGKR